MKAVELYSMLHHAQTILHAFAPIQPQTFQVSVPAALAVVLPHSVFETQKTCLDGHLQYRCCQPCLWPILSALGEASRLL